MALTHQVKRHSATLPRFIILKSGSCHLPHKPEFLKTSSNAIRVTLPWQFVPGAQQRSRLSPSRCARVGTTAARVGKGTALGPPRSLSPPRMPWASGPKPQDTGHALGAPGLCLARSKSAATTAHSYIILEARFPQQRQGVSNLFQETIADCSSSLSCEGQPPVITLSDPAQLLAPLKGAAVPFTKASPTGNVAAFEHPEGLWRAGLRPGGGAGGKANRNRKMAPARCFMWLPCVGQVSAGLDGAAGRRWAEMRLAAGYVQRTAEPRLRCWARKQLFPEKA